MNGMRKFTTTYYKLSSNGKFLEGNGFRLAFISDLHNMEFGSIFYIYLTYIRQNQ